MERPIKPYDVPPSTGIVTVSCSLSAKANVTAPQSAGGFCSVAVSYTASLSEVRILREGQPITDANNKCLPGEAISLTVTGAAQNSPYSWSITGDYFKNFTPSTPSVYEDGGAVVKTLPTLAYRYIKGEVSGSAKKVSCTVQLADGKSAEVEDELKVYQPEKLFKGKKGDEASDFSGVRLSAPYPTVSGEYQKSGMDWSGTFVNLSSYGSGVFGIAQTGNTSRSRYTASGDIYDLPTSASQGLDSGFLYFGREFPVNTVAGATPQTNLGDSPGLGFYENPPGREYVRIVINDSFQTWLMFKSSQAGACYVPLSKMSWSWSADATRGQNIPVPQSTTPVNGADTTTFPSWAAQLNAGATYIKR